MTAWKYTSFNTHKRPIAKSDLTVLCGTGKAELTKVSEIMERVNA